MTCQACHESEAVVHLTQISGESVVTIHLCSKCAAERGVTSELDHLITPLGSFLAALGPAGGLPAVLSGLPDACDGCGATLEDVRASGRLGCEQCWDTFERPLRDLVRRLHGAVQHVGETYHDPADEGDLAAPPPIAHRRVRLREDLREAIDREEFERAAELRDTLRQMDAQADG